MIVGACNNFFFSTPFGLVVGVGMYSVVIDPARGAAGLVEGRDGIRLYVVHSVRQLRYVLKSNRQHLVGFDIEHACRQFRRDGLPRYALRRVKRLTGQDEASMIYLIGPRLVLNVCERLQRVDTDDHMPVSNYPLEEIDSCMAEPAGEPDDEGNNSGGPKGGRTIH